MPAGLDDSAESERQRQKRFEAANTAPGSNGAGAGISDGCSSGVSYSKAARSYTARVGCAREEWCSWSRTKEDDSRAQRTHQPERWKRGSLSSDTQTSWRSGIAAVQTDGQHLSPCTAARVSRIFSRASQSFIVHGGRRVELVERYALAK